MPLPASLLLIATLTPLAAFAVLVFVGKRMGNPFAGYFGTGAVALAFICCLVATITWVNGGTYVDPLTGSTVAWGAGPRGGPIYLPIHWLPVGPGSFGPGPAGFLDVGLYVDSLTVAMFSMVTAIATLVHIFSLGYMAEDKRFPRYFTYLALFCFSMLGLVLGGTALQLFIFWELVGLCSYLLIGFWYEQKSAANAAIKAFVVNRVGDVGFLVGFGILFYHLGNVTLPGLWVALGDAGRGGDVHLAAGTVFPAGLLTVAGIGLFFGAVGKSAQFPLHVWLPDAMEGPTPASALIHAATMVAAGVYLVGRIFPILTPDARLFIAVIGCVTLVMAALIAAVQSDLKRVLAFSTVSQLGYMMLAMGVGSWVGGLFHLLTHAFFKALLFMGAGSVIFAARHEQEMPRFGGLMRKIPVTAVTFLVAVLAIAGTPLFSGYYSKDTILHHAAAYAAYATAHGGSAWYWALFALPTAVAYLTAFYMMRCWMLTFWGRPRDETLHAHAHERPSMYVPLGVLALLTILVGYRWFGARQFLSNTVSETNAYCQRILNWETKGRAGAAGRPASLTVPAVFHGFDQAWPAAEADEGAAGPPPVAPATHAATAPASAVPLTAREADARGEALVAPFTSWPFYAFVVGIGFAFALYANGYAAARRLHALPPLRLIHTWLYRRMYFDELYFFLVVGVTVALSKFAGFFDRWIIDGLVNRTAQWVRNTASAAGWGDDHLIDGAVNGVGTLAHGLGVAVRNPPSGRVRLYVTLLIAAVALGLAGVMIVVLSR